MCTRQKCVCAASIWKFFGVMHNYNNFHAQTESVTGPKKSPNGIKPHNQEKVGLEGFWRLTPSKWPGS
jgi:hypothetical protein